MPKAQVNLLYKQSYIQTNIFYITCGELCDIMCCKEFFKIHCPYRLPHKPPILLETPRIVYFFLGLRHIFLNYPTEK